MTKSYFSVSQRKESIKAAIPMEESWQNNRNLFADIHFSDINIELKIKVWSNIRIGRKKCQHDDGSVSKEGRTFLSLLKSVPTLSYTGANDLQWPHPAHFQKPVFSFFLFFFLF